MLYRYGGSFTESPQADQDGTPVIFDVEKLKTQLHRHFSSSATRALRYSWWYPLLRVCPSSVHTLWLSAKRCSNTRRTRPSVFIIKVPFRARDAYTCITPQPTSTMSLSPLKNSHSRSHSHSHSSRPSPLRNSSSKDHASLSSSSSSSSRSSSVLSQLHPHAHHSTHHTHSHNHTHSRASSPPRAASSSLSQPHSRMHQLEPLQEIDIDVDPVPDPLNYHECNDPACQANLDAYFLHRIETYTPMLQMMRDRQRRKGGGGGVIDDSEPVVVVTNWQHVEHYPSEWVVRFREVVTCSLHPSPIYIETYGTDEQTEDQLMEVIEDVKHSSHLFAMMREKAGEIGKSVSHSIDACEDAISPLDSPRSKPLSSQLRWRAFRQYWPLVLVAFLLVCLVVFRHFLAPSPLPSSPSGAAIASGELSGELSGLGPNMSEYSTLGSGSDRDLDLSAAHSYEDYHPQQPPEPA